jgi:hypothetical protein
MLPKYTPSESEPSQRKTERKVGSFYPLLFLAASTTILIGACIIPTDNDKLHQLLTTFVTSTLATSATLVTQKD